MTFMSTKAWALLYSSGDSKFWQHVLMTQAGKLNEDNILNVFIVEIGYVEGCYYLKSFTVSDLQSVFTEWFQFDQSYSKTFSIVC